MHFGCFDLGCESINLYSCLIGSQASMSCIATFLFPVNFRGKKFSRNLYSRFWGEISSAKVSSLKVFSLSCLLFSMTGNKVVSLRFIEAWDAVKQLYTFLDSLPK